MVRNRGGVELEFALGNTEHFDQVVLATHADVALSLLAQPTEHETRLLQHFKTSANRVYLHRDAKLMPKHRRFWSGWNYRMPPLGNAQTPEVTYWMNTLQKLESPEQHFVSLNPTVLPEANLVDGVYNYRHPMFNEATLDAQKHLWSLQGVDHVWFCGAWFGSGFHEDGLQAGLAVAEQLGGVRRPWNVENELERIHIQNVPAPMPDHLAEAAE